MEARLKEAERELEKVNKLNAKLEYHFTKKEGDLKLKNDKLK